MNSIFTQCETPDDGPAASPCQPMYTCEVCKISMRSAKKLEDHVNHSPLHRAALNESDPTFKMETSTSTSSKRDAIVKYILARVQAVKDSNGALSLYLQKQNGDKYDPTLPEPNLPKHVVSDSEPRRRHTYEEALLIQNEVHGHTRALKTSRQKAEKCHDMVRLSLDAFIDLEASVKSHPKNKNDHLSWLGALNRVRQRTDIEVIKTKLKHGHITSPTKKTVEEAQHPEEK
ncbi:unnamed protein product [Aphanomyces euteiches]